MSSQHVAPDDALVTSAVPSTPPSPPTATATMPPDRKQSFKGELTRQDAPNVYVSLTYDPLDASEQMRRVKSAKAGAVVLFAGCTRDTFAARPVTHLSYSTYAPLALKTLSHIARNILATYALTSIAITHRLGRVDIGDESILIAIASPHRQAAWRAGEQCLEDVKKRVEIWKEEWFEDGGVWRSNRDGKEGVPVVAGGGGKGGGAAAAGARRYSGVVVNGATGNGMGSSPGSGHFTEGGLEV